MGVITPIISVLLSIQLENYRPGAIEWGGMILCLSGVLWAMGIFPKIFLDCYRAGSHQNLKPCRIKVWLILATI